jgi:surface protein
MYSMFYQNSSFNQDISGWDVSSVTSMNRMLYKAYAFDQDIGDWSVGNVTDMQYMLLGVTLSTDYYDSLLIGWERQSLQKSVIFDGGNSIYSSGAAATARQNLISNSSWTITDGGVSPLPDVTTTVPHTIWAYSATGGGTVTSIGGAAVTDRGLCVSTAPAPTTSDRKISIGSGLGTFSYTVDNLEKNTKYYFRAYAINSYGTKYGEGRSFYTSNVQ